MSNEFGFLKKMLSNAMNQCYGLYDDKESRNRACYLIKDKVILNNRY